MFKIDYLKVNYEDNTIEPSLYEFGDSVYIFGKNNVGKTIMLQAIDYVLGKSDFVLEDRDGLENIISLEAKLVNDGRTLFISRSRYNDFGYKYSEDDVAYLTVDANMYKQEITAFILNENSNYFETLKNYLDEDLSFRAFTFINFLDEKGLGNLTNIFPRISTYYNQKRARKLMTFVFNYNNVSKIIELMNEQTELNKTLKTLSEQKTTYNYSVAVIRREFIELQIPFKTEDSLQALKEAFDLFSKAFYRDAIEKRYASKDLGVLLRISCSLSEELKYQENLWQQTKLLDSRNVKSEKLLTAFRELVLLDENYSVYVDDIEALIKKQKLSHDILSVKDFEKTIREIKAKKADIDRQIAVCQKGLNKDSYENILKAIGRIEQAFTNISNIPNLDEITFAEERLKQIEEEISKLRKDFDNTLKTKFDETMLMFYKELDKVKFVADDLNQKNFKILFDPVKITVCGERLKPNSDDISVAYMPGSMARETTWQIIAYLTMFKLFKERFKELPLMPVLFIDGLDQPYDEDINSYPNIYSFIRDKALEIGVQLFVVSTHDGRLIGINDQVHITGFNKTYKR